MSHHHPRSDVTTHDAVDCRALAFLKHAAKFPIAIPLSVPNKVAGGPTLSLLAHERDRIG